MRDAGTKPIYVGKALNLRNRLRSYFQPGQVLQGLTQTMVGKVFDFDVLTCTTDQEALLLECTLIKRYRPRYNIRLRDDKNYLYMKLPRKGDFPRVYTVRKVADDGARYFGPFTNAGALRTTMKTLRRIFPYRTCSDDVFKRGRVCLDYHIKRCSGPCEGLISSHDYHQNLEQIGVFMEGRQGELVRTIRGEMRAASDALEVRARGPPAGPRVCPGSHRRESAGALPGGARRGRAGGGPGGGCGGGGGADGARRQGGGSGQL